MKHIFVDANIIIDFLANRAPFAAAATDLFEHAEQGHVTIYASAVSFNVIYYVLRQSHGHNTTISYLGDLAAIIKIAEVNQQVIESAIASGMIDFEDAVQYYAATGNPLIEAIVSRDRKGFRKSKLPVFTASELLKLL
jgi:predicted nucleic acid-binding protein